MLIGEHLSVVRKGVASLTVQLHGVYGRTRQHASNRVAHLSKTRCRGCLVVELGAYLVETHREQSLE